MSRVASLLSQLGNLIFNKTKLCRTTKQIFNMRAWPLITITLQLDFETNRRTDNTIIRLSWPRAFKRTVIYEQQQSWHIWDQDEVQTNYLFPVSGDHWSDERVIGNNDRLISWDQNSSSLVTSPPPHYLHPLPLMPSSSILVGVRPPWGAVRQWPLMWILVVK